MKEFDFDEIYRPTRILLEYGGLYPKESPTVWYNIKPIVMFSAMFVQTILLVIKSLTDYKNGRIQQGCWANSLLIAAAHGCIQVVYMRSRRSKVEKIVENMKQKSLLLHEDNFDVHLQTNLKITRILRLGLLISCGLTIPLIWMTDLMEDYTVTPSVLPFQVKIDQFALYVVFWIFFMFNCVCVGYTIATCDSNLITLIALAITQLQILYDQIIFSFENVTGGPLSGIKWKQTELKIINSVKKCVTRHVAVIECVESMEDMFSIGYIFHFALILLATGSILFCVAFSPKGNIDFYRCVIFLVADFGIIALLCYAGNELTLQSEYILDACYMANWHNIGSSVAIRRMLFIIMERAKRPLRLTAGKFVNISIITLIALLKNSMSYYTVTKNFYERED